MMCCWVGVGVPTDLTTPLPSWSIPWIGVAAVWRRSDRCGRGGGVFPPTSCPPAVPVTAAIRNHRSKPVGVPARSGVGSPGGPGICPNTTAHARHAAHSNAPPPCLRAPSRANAAEQPQLAGHRHNLPGDTPCCLWFGHGRAESSQATAAACWKNRRSQPATTGRNPMPPTELSAPFTDPRHRLGGSGLPGGGSSSSS